jgi:hypothetical protein
MLAIVVGFPRAYAQRPLSPLPDEGNRVAPFFDGWYANPDGTISLAFGYANLNKSTVEIPAGRAPAGSPRAGERRPPQ